MNLKEGQKAHSSRDREDSTVLADNVSRNKREENKETQSTFVLLARCDGCGRQEAEGSP